MRGRLNESEIKLIRAALIIHKGNRTRAEKELLMPSTTLYRWIKRYPEIVDGIQMCSLGQRIGTGTKVVQYLDTREE